MSASGSDESSGPLASLGKAMGAVAAVEQKLSTALNVVANVLPSFPAVRITDIDIGLPHAHSHPPNLIPPAPPVPLPSTGPIIPIPVMSGAKKTLINGLPAARCGDMGLGIWCGGYVPMYEVFLGSSNVWIEGARAARVGVDITKHCVFSSPKPNDPPMGPMVGFTTTSSPNVLIGGVPMPSLTALAMAAAFKALGKLVRAGARAARRLGQRLGRNMKPGFLKCSILKAEPVDITTGQNVIEQEDFKLPWPLPINWTRRYGSRSTRMGLCGYGWDTPADSRLVLERDGTILFYDDTAGSTFFPSLPDNGPIDEFVNGAVLHRGGGHLQVRVKSGLTYHFGTLDHGTTEYLVERITDPCGNSLTFHRDGGGLRAIVSNVGPRLEVISQEGRIHKIVLRHPLEEKPRTLVRYEYSKEGDLREVCDALQNPYRFFYRNHCLTRHTDRNGLSFFYEFDRYTPEGRVLHTWGDGGLYNYQFKYDTHAGSVLIVDSLGQTTVVALDDLGLPVSETNPLGGLTRFEYDEVGRTAAVVDPAGLRTEYQYDEHGNLLKLTRPDGQSIRTEYNEAHKPVKITNPNGAVWQQEWDAQGLLVRQISPLFAETRYDYDAHGQLVTFTNERGARTRLGLDGFGNLIRLVDAAGHLTEFSYDALGNLTAKIDALGQRTQYSYDLKGRLTKVALPSGSAVGCSYDAQDNLVHYRDENGAVTELEYIGLGEIRRRRQADGHSVEYHYDTEERLIGVTNQRGEGYELRRDPLGRIIEEVDYWGQSWRYSYTPSGHLRESVDPLGRRIGYKSDPLGRILKKILPDPAKPKAEQVEAFEYDANGNLIACNNDAIRIERTFDLEGRLLEERQGEACVVINKYDGSGNRISRTTTTVVDGYLQRRSVSYGYDALDQATAVEVDGHPPIRLTRDPRGQLTREDLGPGLVRRRAYNPDGYLTAQEVSSAAVPRLQQTYEYDRAGNLTQRSDSAFGADQYTYDPVGRIIAHLDPQGRLQSYLNDPAGDRLRTQVRQTAPEHGMEVGWRREGEYAGTRYRFDRAGNLIERTGPKGQTTFTWNASSRLIQSTTEGRVTTYSYDPLGRRVSKTTDGVTTCFVWDGDALLGDARIGKDQRLLGQREWIYYPQAFEPLAMVQRARESEGANALAAPAAFYLYHNDPNGCPSRLLDASGHVVWAAQYNVWGQLERMQVNGVDNPIRLQGQHLDTETGLHYNRHRYYDSYAGQFISQDALRLIAGPNTFRFAPNTLGWIDPLGLVCLDTRVGRFRDPTTGRYVSGTQVRGHFPDSVMPGQRVLYRADPVTGQVTHFQVYNAAGLPLKRVDITGAAHGGVPTPHVVEFTHNVNPHTGQVFPRPNRMVRPAGPNDLL